ncbi:MAG: alcohol dehydrogenase catalytic domain-containing protein [Gammaproteobacteria bacterium]|nr:alcohol dehydrogenase catalytic domain-containing protein [Gammaproteobacteria bacterium]
MIRIPEYCDRVVCRGEGKVALETLPTPLPQAGQLLLKLRLVGLCGTDLFKLDTGADTPGLVLGHELVGEVAAMGEGVGGFDLGDRVAVPHHVPCGQCPLCAAGNETLCAVFRENLLEPGGFSEFVLVRERAVAQAALRVPVHVSDEAAVFIEPAACVLRGIHRAGALTEGTCVVVGAGAMGLLHLLVLKARCERTRVLVIDPVKARRELALELGADAAAPPGERAEAAAGELSPGGADAVFDTVGGAAVLNSSLALTREGGTVVLFAHAPSAERAAFDLNTLFKYERRIIGTYSGSVAEQRDIFALMSEGRLAPSALVSHRLPLAAFADGVMLARQKQALKVLYTGP